MAGSHNSKNHGRMLTCGVGVLVVVVVTLTIARWRKTGDSPPAPPGNSVIAVGNTASLHSREREAGLQSKLQEISRALDTALSRLQTTKDSNTTGQILRELRVQLELLAPQEATIAILSFLSSSRDAQTHLEFTLAEGGQLAGASSLRVFLLDLLGRVEPSKAKEIAEQVLSKAESPDEWAISLRNYAWADPSEAGNVFLRERLQAMIQNDGWRQNPSKGFLEAFDVMVHTQAYELIPQLAQLTRDRENRALGYAAYLTLDRLILTNAATALTPLVEHPEMMEGREQTRANLMARADTRDPAQATLLERYLLDDQRSTEELKAFAGLFPNANYMVSNNLLTPTITPTRDELLAKDQASLTKVEAWLQDPRFEKLRPQLIAIKERLNLYTKQAASQ